MENNNLMNIGQETESIMMDGKSMIMDLTTAVTSFSSMVAKTNEDKAILFKAMNNPDFRLSDEINKTVEVKDVYCEIVTCTQEDGNKVQCPRIVLIDKDGKGHTCVSIGVFSALRKLFQIFGMPSWEKPLKLEVVQITKGNFKILTLNYVG